jgi:hypothetical protein
MKSNNLVFIVFAIFCLLNSSLTLRKARKVRADITNNNDNAGGTISNNNDAAAAGKTITNNNDLAGGKSITNNNSALETAAVTTELPQITNNNALPDNTNTNISAEKPSAKVASDNVKIEITGSAETMIDQDEMNFLISFRNDIHEKFFEDWADMKKNIDAFKEALIALGIPDEDFSVKQNVDQFHLLKKYLKKLTENRMYDEKDEKADSINNNNNNADSNNNNNNVATQNNDQEADHDGFDDFDLYSLFYVTVRDNAVAEKLAEAVGKYKGRIEDVNFTISEKLENDEKAKLLNRAIDHAIFQAKAISEKQGFANFEIQEISNERYLLQGQVMRIAIDVKFRI